MKTFPIQIPTEVPMRDAQSADAASTVVPLTRVVILDDHKSLRQMLAFVLKTMGGFDVVGGASGGVQGLRVCKEVQPDVVVLDLALPELKWGAFDPLSAGGGAEGAGACLYGDDG